MINLLGNQAILKLTFGSYVKHIAKKGKNHPTEKMEDLLVKRIS